MTTNDRAHCDNHLIHDAACDRCTLLARMKTEVLSAAKVEGSETMWSYIHDHQVWLKDLSELRAAEFSRVEQLKAQVITLEEQVQFLTRELAITSTKVGPVPIAQPSKELQQVLTDAAKLPESMLHGESLKDSGSDSDFARLLRKVGVKVYDTDGKEDWNV